MEELVDMLDFNGGLTLVQSSSSSESESSSLSSVVSWVMKTCQEYVYLQRKSLTCRKRAIIDYFRSIKRNLDRSPFFDISLLNTLIYSI